VLGEERVDQRVVGGRVVAADAVSGGGDDVQVEVVVVELRRPGARRNAADSVLLLLIGREAARDVLRARLGADDFARIAKELDDGFIQAMWIYGQTTCAMCLSREEESRERIEDCRAFATDPAGQLEKGRADNPTWPESELEPWARSKTQVDLDFLELGIANLVEPWDDIAAAVTVPTLVLLAGRGGPVSPAARARAAQLDNHHLDLHVVAGTGHCIRRDDPAAYHALVDPFLAEHAR
jgi:pimeloyl-ACP methyl ester carboxylesterase